jgi:hypothetical protein
VLDVVQELEHALPERVGGRERREGSECLDGLLREPAGGELPLDVLAVEQVTEEQLVLDDGVAGQDER